jgi:7-carboxy-7-deazaguanine synthase
VIVSAKSTGRTSDAPAATYPVVEIFGPTVQGEGPDAGRPAYFVRFGGCDWRCSWCDSMHAVDPAQVREHAQRLSVGDILERLGALGAGPQLVVLSGGNPALLQLGELVDALQRSGRQVAVETQGSVWRDWLRQVDRLVVSPKPPSSGMTSAQHAAQFARFAERLAAGRSAHAALKVVVFDERDLDWAQDIHAAYPSLPFYLSAGTDVDVDEPRAMAALRERYRWLCEAVAARGPLADCRVLPQLHVIAWGTARGV